MIIEKNYNDFLKNAQFLEENKKCKKCKTKSLVHCDYQSHFLMCSNCGTYYELNKKTKRLVIC